MSKAKGLVDGPLQEGGAKGGAPSSGSMFSEDPQERAVGRAAAKDKFVESHRAALEAIPGELNVLKARLHPGRGGAMKGHKVIDHLLFRKLFAETFSSGEYGNAGAGQDYVIEPAGVRWKETEHDFIASREQVGYPPSDADTIFYVEHLIRPATLAFACSTDQAEAWANRNRDTGAYGKGPTGFIYVPDWLIDALGQIDADGALVVLADAGLSIYAELLKAQAEGDFQGQKLSRAELRNLHQAIEAFETIKVLLAEIDGAKTTVRGSGNEEPSRSKRTKAAGRQREDAMTRELTALRSEGTCEPDEMMAKLQEMAGKKGSCVLEATPKGVKWRTDDGTQKLLEMDALKPRLKRLKDAAKTPR